MTEQERNELDQSHMNRTPREPQTKCPTCATDLEICCICRDDEYCTGLRCPEGDETCSAAGVCSEECLLKWIERTQRANAEMRKHLKRIVACKVPPLDKVPDTSSAYAYCVGEMRQIAKNGLTEAGVR